MAAPPTGTAATGGSGTPPTRVRARVEGAVQGVGFRPYVYRLASSLGLAGFVRNDPGGVLVELEGGAAEVGRFLELLPESAPPLAVIERVTSTEVRPRGGGAFTILRSRSASATRTLLSPDVATCAACLAELFDPADRRHRYPFLNCTDCGPRYTIARALPWDRPATTMAGFPLCEACRTEYEDPRDRRFHAQPNACADCGPRLSLLVPPNGWVSAEGEAALAAAVEAIVGGGLVAVKGLGGYHLACRADAAEPVERLRRGKTRPDKPFAVMVRGMEAARELASLSRAEEALLAGRERPVVLARRLPGAALAEGVAPGRPDVGLMLPYTPLHHLLLADAGAPVVMTSGNLADEPIVVEDAEAVARLGPLVDLVLAHDRPIHCRADDSVVRSLPCPAGTARPAAAPSSRPGASRSAGSLVLRRSRGYAPHALHLPLPARRPILAVGGHLKNTFCLARGPRAWVGPHVGDLSDWETLAAFREGVRHMAALFGVEPAVVAHDLHPDYLSTREALATPAETHVAVQHHHAHLAACLAEHGETGPALGAIFDGTGYGPDGTVWGGELLLGDLAAAERVGHLLPVRLPGGEAAVREPWRMACAWLARALEEDVPAVPPTIAAHVDAARWDAVARMAGSGLSSPLTTSMGRLFDAVAALCGLHPRSTWEGQAAMALEAAAAEAEEPVRPYAVEVVDEGGASRLDPRPALRGVVRDLAGGRGVPAIAASFHEGLALASARWCVVEASRRSVDTAVLSGGVWQNVRLLGRTAALLERQGLRVLVPEALPPNDGGLAFGQAAVAASRTQAAL